MPRHDARPPLGAVRTFAVAVASGLLVIGLALEVAVARFNSPQVDSPANLPGHRPAVCTDAPQHPYTGPDRSRNAEASQGAPKGGICS